MARIGNSLTYELMKVDDWGDSSGNAERNDVDVVSRFEATPVTVRKRMCAELKGMGLMPMDPFSFSMPYAAPGDWLK